MLQSRTPPVRARQFWLLQSKIRRRLSSTTSTVGSAASAASLSAGLGSDNHPALKGSAVSEPPSGTPKLLASSNGILSRFSDRSARPAISVPRTPPFTGPSQKAGLTLAERMSRRQQGFQEAQNVVEPPGDASNIIPTPTPSEHTASGRPGREDKGSLQKSPSPREITKTEVPSNSPLCKQATDMEVKFKIPDFFPKTNLKELFGSSQRISAQAQIEKGKFYFRRLPSAHANSAPIGTVQYAQLALDRNKQISLELREQSIRIITDSLKSR
ncbi:hypothetical protein F5I97DRAFT_1829932 [Phlebopus sp. FC_14]|nr:hypothetical protein F5I97DRAFT_1829932 [Phlebopus sp. FC_14]